MSKVHILGIGSPSGDDQAGWLTVDALAACGVHAEHELVIEKLDRPGAGLVSRLDSDWVILVDAMQGGAPPGTIRCFEQDTWPDYAQGRRRWPACRAVSSCMESKSARRIRRRSRGQSSRTPRVSWPSASPMRWTPNV